MGGEPAVCGTDNGIETSKNDIVWNIIKNLVPDKILLLTLKWSPLIDGYIRNVIVRHGDQIDLEKIKQLTYEEIIVLSYVKHYEKSYKNDFNFFGPSFHLVWSTSQEIEAGLKLYEHTADWLYWLLEEMIQDEFWEGVVIVQKEIERRGFNRQSVTERFDL